ncbi:MAG: hypothetical protein QGF59_20560, partial [Pirellulaceae bacterium]|nr:hypothetical protein [Pirellulaceae bacterium]
MCDPDHIQTPSRLNAVEPSIDQFCIGDCARTHPRQRRRRDQALCGFDLHKAASGGWNGRSFRG